MSDTAHTLESLMRLANEFAASTEQNGYWRIHASTAAKRGALKSALAALVQPQEPVAHGPGTPSARFHHLMGELEKRFPDPKPFSASPSEGRYLAMLDAAIAAPVAQVERGEPATFNPLTCQLSASDFPGPKQREEWEAAPAAQEAQPINESGSVEGHATGPLSAEYLPVGDGSADPTIERARAGRRAQDGSARVEHDLASTAQAGIKPGSLSPAQEAPGPVAQRLAAAEELLRESHDGLYQVSPGLWSRVDDFLAGQPAQHKEQE